MSENTADTGAEATSRAAALIAQAIFELQQAQSVQAAGSREEISAGRQALEEMASRFDRQLGEEREQRLLLAGQLSSLAAALDNLVGHLQGLSRLMAELLERLAAPGAPGTAAGPETEAPFLPGGEGLSLTLLNVPGFQALMDFQKAFVSLEQVAGASVERFQEGDSRMLLRLRAAVRAGELAEALRQATGHAIVVEEAKPELQSLRLKVVSAS